MGAEITQHTEYIRVTSVPYSTIDYVIFNGVPLKKDSFQINDGRYYITIKCDASLLPIYPAIGQQWQITGQRLINAVEHGDFLMDQHTFDSPTKVRCTMPENGEQLIQFIAKEIEFKGIGEQKARVLWNKFGDSFHSVLSTDSPDSRNLLRELLSNESVDALYAGYAKYKNLEACNWMSEIKIPSQVQQRLLKYHDDQSVKAIRDNPYVLLSFGLAFNVVDVIAKQHFSIAENNSKRLSAAVEMAIRKEIEKGHTFTTKNAIRPTLRRLLGSSELAAQAFKEEHQKTQFVLNKKTANYHPTAQLLMESVIAKRLKKLKENDNRFDQVIEQAYFTAIAELPYELTKKQIQAVITTLCSSVSCITGGAGTGKTTVLRAVLRSFDILGYRIHPVALSGRATMRLGESIGFASQTIAAFLHKKPIESNGKETNHLLVIDEASMIDLPTMYRLVTHTNTNVKIIFTGDPDQLPPIGCGKVLSDIVESETIANTKLNVVKRQEYETGIPEYSKLINQGIVPKCLSMGAITFHETPKASITQRCTQLFLESPKGSRIISSTKTMVSEINKLVQNAVNPKGQRLEFKIHGEKFYCDIRRGDTILFTKNNYDIGIQNGSLGTLISTDVTDHSYGVVTLDTGAKVDITQNVLNCMELGYCITLHKAQGSQFPRIVIALRKGRIVDRAWFYTAITRAEAEVHIVGTSNELKAITESVSHAHRRNSYLAEMLRNEIVDPESTYEEHK